MIAAAASLPLPAPLDRNETWNRCKEILRSRLSVVEFATWVEPVEVASLEGDLLELAVPNRFHKDYLRRLVDLDSALKQVVGRSLRIGFVEKERAEQEVKGPAAVAVARPPAMRRVSVPQGPSVRPTAAASGARPTARPEGMWEAEYSGLQRHFTFERFVEGPCNQLARGVGLMVSNGKAAHSFNPMIVYGSSGAGKTHLLQAIGNRAAGQGMRVRYVTSERFVSSFVSALKGNVAWSFTRAFVDTDLLLVDDVQFLGKTEKIQEQFAGIFARLVQENRQVVLSFDRAPAKIPGLQAALVSRFQGGVMAELTLPGFETRRRIVEQRAAELNLHVGEDTVDYIARTRGSVRQLEGILNRLLAEQTFGIKSPSLGSVIAEITGEDVGVLDLPEVCRVVSGMTGIPVDVIQGRSRRRAHVMARHVAMYLARRVAHNTFATIAVFFDGRDHSSVMHGVQSIENLCEVDPEVKKLVTDLLRALGAAE